MDGQWATVLAAGIAASVTLAGAAIAYRAGRRQVRDQGEIAHSQWLRTQREQAYVEYVTACEIANDAIYKCSLRFDEVLADVSSPQFAGNRAEAVFHIGIDEAYNLVDASQNPLNRIIMLGPDNVAAQAEQLRRALADCASGTHGLVVRLSRENPPQREIDLVGDRMNEVFLARTEFTKMARQVLTGEILPVTIAST
ncbi:hypothetical protein [Streptomyces sp. INR7]|uniref:hypothetical protein n=1 Tax=Streptomyces sp. INR7 TaxID=2607753 RepID=UPI00162862FE|nr:hypothetical protein [Streptomyces sp. INR7]QNE27608.1 hypothetical protein F1D59_24955 [Streptomyces sp. INR7]